MVPDTSPPTRSFDPRDPVVCPTCDGSGWQSSGSTPAGGFCASCRGSGEVTTELDDELLMAADSMLSLIFYREANGLSEQTRREMPELLTRLRTRTDRAVRRG